MTVLSTFFAIFSVTFGCIDAQVKVNVGISLICELSSTLVCTETNNLKKESQSRSRPKVFQKEPGFKVWNHSRSFKHPSVTSTNFLPCHKTSSNPFPITSPPPSPANGRRIPADPDGSGRGKWLAAESESSKYRGHFIANAWTACPSVHLPLQAYKLTQKKVTNSDPMKGVFWSTCCSKQLSPALLMETKLRSAHCLLFVHLLFEECEWGRSSHLLLGSKSHGNSIIFGAFLLN